MFTGRKCRLDLTPEQLARCEEFGRGCAAVWNTGLEQRRAYRHRGAWINYHEQAAQLAGAKAEHLWLKAVPGHILQQTLMDLDKACRTHGTWRVNWRAQRRWVPSFRFPEGAKMKVEQLNGRHARVKLPKLGWVRFRLSRPLGGSIRSATVSRDGNRWMISFLINDGQTTPEHHVRPNTAVGLDRGVVAAVACSDGVVIDRACTTRGERQRYRRLQQQLARQRRGSNSRRKTITSMRALMQRERDRRRDFCAQTANYLATENSVVVMEDLKTRNMTRSAKGTVEQPGRNVRQKAGLNKAILAKGWGQLLLALESKARYTGSTIVKVPAAYTSQKCSACGEVDPASRESQARFRCRHCPAPALNADVNAARKILAAGLAVTACGDLDISRSVKQEPAGNREELLLQPV
ncbi:transposase [Hoyosella sp. YIM 151337]|uniref:RNA-guided endonuclease InsQ/TnpB family protein n=1 Tax=Hoyosella sp. YIM 151337 TaxID=2992742 RepID=UPI0022362530|nr:transposase [Hoyosella sp. YIM 151337]MCW4355046.1 transposase [Hoyosella sp. YIM 151337]